MNDTDLVMIETGRKITRNLRERMDKSEAKDALKIETIRLNIKIGSMTHTSEHFLQCLIRISYP